MYDEDLEAWYPEGPVQCRARGAVLDPCSYTSDPRGSCGGELVCSPNRLLDPGEPHDYCFPRGEYGNTCFTHNDCLPGLFCEPFEIFSEQRCDYEGLAGDDCLDGSDGDERCAAGLYCPTLPTNDEIDDSYKCHRLPEACEPCSAQTGCVDSAFCKGGQCVGKPLRGQRCETAPCAKGLVCITAQLNGSCHAVP